MKGIKSCQVFTSIDYLRSVRGIDTVVRVNNTSFKGSDIICYNCTSCHLNYVT